MKGIPVIRANELTRKFGAFVAVDRISFEVHPGELFGFLGANGAGKTTAMRMLSGLIRPTSGTASVLGYDVYRQSEAIKRSIGYMSQRFSLYEDLTIMENIRFYGGIYGLDSRLLAHRADEMLRQLDLELQRDQLVRSLPTGWRQKLAFAVAILHRPRLVFLDEPTGGVDPIVRREFWEWILNYVALGNTVFATTHYMDEAEYCSRLSVMVDGRLAAIGSPSELRRQYGVHDMEELFLNLATSSFT
ncbi:MAG: ABC transporter ATP-binding protein [Saprospiraceae bacterium]|nr:ABC transporter ATP-binding protein [Saprospiraceae bacterium]